MDTFRLNLNNWMRKRLISNRKVSFSCIFFLFLFFLTFYSSQAAAKMTAMAHMVNSRGAVEWAMQKGANGIEVDLQFNDSGDPFEFRHGGVCDCSCLCPLGDCKDDDVCKALWSDTGSHCNAREDVNSLLITMNRFSNQLAVVYIDSKIDEDTPNLSAAGANVIAKLDQVLFAGGFKGQVVIGTPSATAIAYTRAAVNAANRSPNKAKYFFAIDGEGTDFPAAMNARNGLLSLPTKNRAYSTGITVCLPNTFNVQIRLAAHNQRLGVIGSVGIWTLDKEASMNSYLTSGANSIITNYPQIAVRAIRNFGGELAKPGEALRVATSDAIVTKLPVGFRCRKDGECQNGACGRRTAADNASLVCCASGQNTLFGGFDYCKGMPDGSVCWSDAMCATGYCRGNNGGTRKGVCGKLNNKVRCGKSADCKSGACGRASAQNGTQTVCCSSGRNMTYWGYTYCKRMSKGTVCWTDSMCSSGNCRGNGWGTRRGRCD